MRSKKLFGARTLAPLAGFGLAASCAAPHDGTSEQSRSGATARDDQEATDHAFPSGTCVTTVNLGLGVFGYAASATHVNERGKVAGFAQRDRVGSGHAFFWDGGEMIDIGTLGGSQSGASALNDHGVVVGRAERAGEGMYPHAFLWRDGVMTGLGGLGDEGAESRANDINNCGQVVGLADVPDEDGLGHAFLWEGGVMTDLGTLGGNVSVASRINDRGQIIGDSNRERNGLFHAFLWEGGVMTDLGTLCPDCTSHAVAINEQGQIAGSSRPGGASGAFFWDEGVMTEIGSAEARATVGDLNDRGQVVGTLFTSEWKGPAYVWEGGTMTHVTPMPALGAATARAINDHGHVVGYFSDGLNSRAFFWNEGELMLLADEGTESYAHDVNNRGQIAGTLDGRATLWEIGECPGGTPGGDDGDDGAGDGAGDDNGDGDGSDDGTSTGGGKAS
jgi:probable HAF family extracellular repeat protein